MARQKAQEEEDLKAIMDPWAPKEREVMLVEIENRLRDMIMRILKPSMEKASNISGELEDLRQMVYKHDEALGEVEILKYQVTEQSELTKLFESELEKMSMNNRALEDKIMMEQNTARLEMRDLKSNLDKKSATITNVSRTAERLWEEAQRLQKQHDEYKKTSDERSDQIRTGMDAQKEEVMEVIFDLQTNHGKLYEDVWSDDHGITHLAEEIRRAHQTLTELPKVQQRLNGHDKHMEDLEKHMQACQNSVTNNKKEMDQLDDTVQNNVDSLRGEFREVSSTLSAHHAAMAKGIRESYKEELKHAATLRADAQRFMKETDTRCSEVEAQMISADKHIQHLHKEIVKDIEEVNRKRKKDRLGLESSIKESAKAVSGFKDQFDGFYKGMEHIAGVINIMLEGERVESALSIQDYVDRRQRSHLACKGDLDQPLKPEHAVQGMLKVCNVDRPIREDDGHVDVRKGFKKALYMPGKVSYGDAMYERHDLLLIRDKLLVKAQETLRSGPTLHAEPSKRKLRQAAESPPPKPNKDVDGPIKDGGYKRSSGQRPGSQQQPHAGGSRGHDRGSLANSDPLKNDLKLPLISDNGTVTSIQPKALTAR